MQSPNQPSLITATSMLTMSPFFSVFCAEGMPWQTTWLTEVHTTLREALVAHVGRDRALHVDDVVVAEAVELLGGDAGLHVRADHLQHLGREVPGLARQRDLLGRLQGTAMFIARPFAARPVARPDGRAACGSLGAQAIARSSPPAISARTSSWHSSR